MPNADQQSTTTPHGYWDCDCGRECSVKLALPDCRAEWVSLPEPRSAPKTTERALRLRNLRPWARSRVVVLAVMPFVVLIHTARGVWIGLCEGVEEARDAWRAVR